jgi:cytochrome P450
MLAHILFNPELATAIRKETAQAFRSDGTIDNDFLTQHCPILESVWFEVLRLYATVTTIRKASQDTQLGKYNIKTGDTLLYSARQLSFDADAFGPNHGDFDSMRFFRSPELKYAKNLRPFGGGRFLCPGRHLAKHVATSCVAIVLRRYQAKQAFPQAFPRVVENKPAIGIMESLDDLHLILQERQA